MDERKLYDPQELVTIPLTRDQWHKVTAAIQNDADRFHASMTWWLNFCDNPKMGAETARRYELGYKELDELRAAIENILLEPWAPKPAPANEEE